MDSFLLACKNGLDIAPRRADQAPGDAGPVSVLLHGWDSPAAFFRSLHATGFYSGVYFFSGVWASWLLRRPPVAAPPQRWSVMRCPVATSPGGDHRSAIYDRPHLLHRVEHPGGDVSPRDAR